LVHVSDVSGIGLDTEVHEGGFEFQQLAYLQSLALFFDYLVCVLFEQSEDIQIFVKSLDLVALGVVVAMTLCKLGQFFHKRDKNVLYVNLNVECASCVEQLLQRLEVELVREGLDHALHQVLLRHRVFTHDHDFEDAR